MRREATEFNLCGREEEEKSSLSKSSSKITISSSLPSARATRPEGSPCHPVALAISRTAGLRHARARARRPERAGGRTNACEMGLHESYYITYRPSDTVTVRASHVDDVGAGRSPWHGGPRGVLSRARPLSRRAFFCRYDHIAELACYVKAGSNILIPHLKYLEVK